MAEAVAAVASIIAIIQISDRVIAACKFYIQAASDTPSELKAILIEISTPRAILERLRFLQSYAQSEPGLWKQLLDKQGPLEELKRLMLDLEKLFPQDDFHSSVSAPSAKKAKLLRASLAWPFKAHRAQELLKAILQQKTNLSLALSIEISHDVKQIKQSTEQMHAILTDAQPFELYRWLEVTDPSPIHHRSRKLHEQDTCDWMLRSDNWKQWIAGQLRCLWINGIPGAGKTVLTSYLIEQLESHVETLNRVGHAYYYCYFGHNQDESGPFLRWTISQLCRQSGQIPGNLLELHKHGKQPDLPDLLSALETVLQHYDFAYVILDAVDESKPREDLLRTIRDLVTDTRKCPRAHLESLPMSNELIEDDIRKYVRAALQSHAKFQRWSADLQSEVEDALVLRSKGMFRWIVCQLDRLRRLKLDGGIIRNAIATLPDTLDETYDRIFLEIPADEHLFVRDALRWICFHQDVYDDKLPLGAEILLQETELSIKAKTGSVIDQDYDVERLRDVFGCLIHVNSNNHVVLAHYTVKEYLESDRICSGSSSFFRIEPGATTKSLVPLVLMHCQELEYLERLEEPWDGEDQYSDVFQRLDVYCVVTSVIALSSGSLHLTDESSLPLVIRLLDPSGPHYCQVAEVLCCFTNFLCERDLYVLSGWDFPDWSLSNDCSEAATLLHIMLLSRDANDDGTLSRKFLEGRDFEKVVNSELEFTMFCDDQDMGIEGNEYHFRGTFFQVMSLLSWLWWYDSNWLLELIDSRPEMSLLFGFVAYHRDPHHPRGHKGACPLQPLLRSVDQNLEGYSVTPLQIAVSSKDGIAVEELLIAGADPNGAGDPQGMPFDDGHILAWSNRLHGIAPLHIYRNEQYHHKIEG